MVAMLVTIAVAAVWMAAALPSWRQQAIREKEAELIFRGEQYARAIFLYRQQNNGASPQTVEQLVDGRFLRKKYLDPITGKDFVPVGGIAPVSAGRQGGQAPFAPPQTVAGITGVRSSSNEQSIKIYQNQSVYSQWPFDWVFAQAKAGAAPTPEGGRRGQPGGGGREGRGLRGGGRGPVGPGGRGDELAPIGPRRGGLPGPPPPPPPPGRGGRGF